METVGLRKQNLPRRTRGWVTNLSAVSIDGDTALVSVLFDDVGSNINQGSVYIFTRYGAVWTEQANLTAPDGQAQDFFGNTIDGETVLPA